MLIRHLLFPALARLLFVSAFFFSALKINLRLIFVQKVVNFACSLFRADDGFDGENPTSLDCPTTAAQSLAPRECQRWLQDDRRCTKSGSLAMSELPTKGKPSPPAPARCSAPPPWPPTSLARRPTPGSSWSCSRWRVPRCPFAFHLGVGHRCLLRRERTRGKCRNSSSRSGFFSGSNRQPED